MPNKPVHMCQISPRRVSQSESADVKVPLSVLGIWVIEIFLGMRFVNHLVGFGIGYGVNHYKSKFSSCFPATSLYCCQRIGGGFPFFHPGITPAKGKREIFSYHVTHTLAQLLISIESVLLRHESVLKNKIDPQRLLDTKSKLMLSNQMKILQPIFLFVGFFQ